MTPNYTGMMQLRKSMKKGNGDYSNNDTGCREIIIVVSVLGERDRIKGQNYV